MDAEKENTAEQIISQEVNAVANDPARVRENGCAACHVLFTLVGRMSLSETDAADLLTEVLLARTELNDRFIEMVESVAIRIMNIRKHFFVFYPKVILLHTIK